MKSQQVVRPFGSFAFCRANHIINPMDRNCCERHLRCQGPHTIQWWISSIVPEACTEKFVLGWPQRTNLPWNLRNAATGDFILVLHVQVTTTTSWWDACKVPLFGPTEGQRHHKSTNRMQEFHQSLLRAQS